MEKRLYRSRSDRMIFGVCGGLADYLAVDPVLVRVAFVLLGIAGVGILLYLVLAIVVPLRETAVAPQDAAVESTEEVSPDEVEGRRRGGIGLILIAVGLIFLLSNLGVFTWGRFWPIVLIVIGLALILAQVRR